MKILQRVPNQTIEKFLGRLANLPMVSPGSSQSLKKAFPQFLPDFPMDSTRAKFFAARLEELRLQILADNFPPTLARSMAPPSQEEITGQLVLFLCKCVQKAWVADTQTRDWKVFVLRVQLWGLLMPEIPGGWEWRLPPDPPMSALEQALVYLQHKGRMARRCANDECAEPYFFAEKKNQKFCSDTCATPSRREAKRLWAERNRASKKEGKR
jgi:hypothetical protein